MPFQQIKSTVWRVVAFTWVIGVTGSIGQAASVTLAWDANPEPDIAGYRVHYGKESGVYPSVLDVENETSATVPDLDAGNSYHFVVTAYNTAGLESLPSNEVVAEIPDANSAPVLTLVSPENASEFQSPAKLTLVASASDPDGSVAKVEFFEGQTKLGEDRDAPFVITWGGVFAGTYSLTARATDNEGAEVVTPVTVATVKGWSPEQGGPPTLVGSELLADGSVKLTVIGDAGKTVRIEFTDDISGPSWTTLATTVINDGLVHVIDPTPVVPDAAPRFYQITAID